MSYLCNLYLFAHSGVQHIFPLCFCFACLRRVYPMLPVSLDCLFLIGTSVFSYVYQPSSSPCSRFHFLGTYSCVLCFVLH